MGVRVMPVRKPFHTECRLTYDSPREIAVGDYIRTPAGSAYFITEVRRPRSKYRFRKNIRCLRWPPSEIPAGATVHDLHWYSRSKGTRR